MNNINELQDKITFLENKLKNLESNIPKCLICHDLVQCPVTINGFKSVNGSNKNKFSYYKCNSSVHNPVCYMCFIEYLQKSNNLTYIKCLHNCCKVKKNSIYSYGDIGRSETDLPENVMWRALDKNGITKCRYCNTECNTVINLGKHVIYECENRYENCYACSKLFKRNELIEHNKICNIKCRYCNIILEPDKKKQFKNHFCIKKPLFKCIECKQFITREDIDSNTHINCSNITNNERINSNQIHLNTIPINDFLSTNDLIGPIFTNSPTSLLNRQLELDRQLITPLITRPIISRNSFFNRVIQRPINSYPQTLVSPIDLSGNNLSDFDMSDNELSNNDLSENNLSNNELSDNIPVNELTDIPLDNELTNIFDDILEYNSN